MNIEELFLLLKQYHKAKLLIKKSQLTVDIDMQIRSLAHKLRILSKKNDIFDI